jgi:hypothetical protein
MTVSQTLPLAVPAKADSESVLVLVLIMWSALRMSRRIFPDGVWMASFAGFSRAWPDLIDDIADVEAVNPSMDAVDALEYPALLDTILSALDGRMPAGETRPPGLPSLLIGEEGGEDGCCRTAKTKVLLRASRAHCG